jgi:hypothetical protein
VSSDGKVAGIVGYPADPERLKVEIIPLLVDAGLHEVSLRVGLIEQPRKQLVFAIDLRSLGDEHGILRNLVRVLVVSGCRPLLYELPPDEIFSKASDLVLADDVHPGDGPPSTNGHRPDD